MIQEKKKKKKRKQPPNHTIILQTKAEIKGDIEGHLDDICLFLHDSLYCGYLFKMACCGSSNKYTSCFHGEISLEILSNCPLTCSSAPYIFTLAQTYRANELFCGNFNKVVATSETEISLYICVVWSWASDYIGFRGNLENDQITWIG